MKNLIGLILIGAVAAGAWLWLTDPEKAEEVSEKIKLKARDVGAATTQAVEEAEPQLEKAKAAAAHAADKVHRATTQAIENAAPYVDKIKAATTQATEKVRQKVAPSDPED